MSFHPKRIAIVVPPFGPIETPTLAAHILARIASGQHYEAKIFYLNIDFAARFGLLTYKSIASHSTWLQLGERIFARPAYNAPPCGRNFKVAYELLESDSKLSLEAIFRLEQASTEWLSNAADHLLAWKPQIVCCTASYQQLSAAIALLNVVKTRDETVLTVVGGAHCRGETAGVIADLSEAVDYVFADESELSFNAFLSELSQSVRPPKRVLSSTPVTDLDRLPSPDFTEFIQAYRVLTRGQGDAEISLVAETSRGCWWGQKHHCSFCGINGPDLIYRKKSAARAFKDVCAAKAAGASRIVMCDNIMPNEYYVSLLPQLAETQLGIRIFYEQKSNISLKRMLLLKAAGVSEIQVGIESFCSGLLRLIKKGVTARQNISTLRYALSCGVDTSYNLLWGIPRDRAESYVSTNKVIQLIVHLQPPEGAWHISIDRFSPFFHAPEEFGIRTLVPYPAYSDIFPPSFDVNSLAYFFTGQYPAESHSCPDVVAEFLTSIRKWQESWKRVPRQPILTIERKGHGLAIEDTRGGEPRITELSLDRGKALFRSRSPLGGSDLSDFISDGLGLVDRDGDFIPLPTGDPALLLELEECESF